MNVGAGIAALTITLSIWMSAHQPAPVSDHQVPFCVISMYVAGKNPLTGEYEFGWGQGYGPCSQQDIYRHI